MVNAGKNSEESNTFISKVGYHYGKYLVVDDEIAENENDRDDFMLDVGVPKDFALFASNYQEALDIILSINNIDIFYIDCKIPENKKKYSYATGKDNSEEWGLALIPHINEVHAKADIAIYSAYVNVRNLNDRVKNFKNILGCYDKPDGLQQKKQLYNNAIQKRLPNSIIKSPLPVSSQAEVFDYSLLSLDQQKLLQGITQKIKVLIRKTLEDIVDIGRYLTEVKEFLPHGQFYRWLKTEFGWDGASSARAMSVYRRLKTINLTDFTGLQIYPSAVYSLLPTEVPDGALIEMKELAQSGVTINIQVAEMLKAKYKEKDTSLSKKKEKIDNPIETQPKILSDISNSSFLDVEEKTVAIRPKQQIVKVIPREDRWKIGKHLIICAEPNSKEFLKILPKDSSLCLCFPPNKYWTPNENLSYHSLMTFYSQYQDIDLLSLVESVQKIIEITTNQGDPIVVCYLPFPSVLMLINDLDCKAYVAEPNYEKCLALVKLVEAQP